MGQTETLSGDALVTALRQGGYVIVMRHARSPRVPPSPATANPDNANLERQLDAEGRAGATAMGQALRDLKIPIGDVLTSPTYRAMETVKLAQLTRPQPHIELGDGGQSMQGVTDAQAAWLRDHAARPPSGGTNTVIVTHMPNLVRAFPDWGGGVSDGEAVILRPSAAGAAVPVARVPIDQWSRLPK